MAEHRGLAVILLDLLRVLHLVHAHSLPSVVLPKDLVQGAKQNPDVLLHGRTARPGSNLQLIFLD